METVKKMSLVPTILKWVGIVLGGLVVLVGLILLLAHLLTPVFYHGFFKDAKQEYLIPGLSDGFIPQGFDYLEEEEIYLQCGYMKDNSASRIYILPEGREETDAGYVLLQTEDGKAYTGHTGGITSDGTRVWLANDGEGTDNCVWSFLLSDLLALENGGTLTLKDRFYPESRSAYCMVDGEYLWVGEFYRAEDYPTKSSHGHIMKDGTPHNALICAYRLNDAYSCGVMEEKPEKLLSVTGQVQGMARTEDGGFVLSTSYGLSTSHLLFYTDVTKEAPDAGMMIGNDLVNVWYLDAEAQVRDLKLPPMSEEPVIRDGRLYVLTESASQKYLFGNFTRGRHVYSVPVEE